MSLRSKFTLKNINRSKIKLSEEDTILLWHVQVITFWKIYVMDEFPSEIGHGIHCSLKCPPTNQMEI